MSSDIESQRPVRMRRYWWPSQTRVMSADEGWASDMEDFLKGKSKVNTDKKDEQKPKQPEVPPTSS